MSFDLTNKNIKDTFQNLLQKTGSEGHLYDLVGNQVDNLTIGGTLTANSYVTSESIVNTSSGSTAFGNSSDDSHTFQGSITASGNISSSGTINASEVLRNGTSVVTNITPSATQGNFNQIKGGVAGVVQLADLGTTGNPKFNHITASGDISASGTISSSKMHTNGLSSGHITASGNMSVGGFITADRLGTLNDLTVGDDLTVGNNIIVPDGSKIVDGSDLDDFIRFNQTNRRIDTHIDNTVILSVGNGIVGINTTPVANMELTVRGNISASGDIFNTQTIQMTAASSTVINTFNTSSFQTCKYLLQVISASSIQSSEMLVVQNSSNAFNTEYSQINSGLNLVDFTTDVNNSNVRLLGNSSFISCSVKLIRTLI